MVLAYINGKVEDSSIVMIIMFVVAFVFGFAILPSTHIVLEFGCELGDPVPPASCNMIMITFSHICTIIGVIYSLSL